MSHTKRSRITMGTTLLAIIGSVGAGVSVMASAAAAAAPVAAGEIHRVSKAPSGRAPNASVELTPAVSGNGRFVVYSSWASNIIPGAEVGEPASLDVFRHDTQTGRTTLVSRTASGEAAGYSDRPATNHNGRYVTFESRATDLNGAPPASGDRPHVYRYDALTHGIQRISKVSEPTLGTGVSAISGAGRFVSYASEVNGIVSGDTDGEVDVFRYDTMTDTTILVSEISAGEQGPVANVHSALSKSGRFVVFQATPAHASDAVVYTQIYRFDAQTGQTRLVSHTADGSISDGSSGSPAISDNGRVISFGSTAPNLGDADGQEWDVFRYDATLDQAQLVSEWPGKANGTLAWEPDLSGDGQYVVFGDYPSSSPGNIYRYEAGTGIASIISVAVTSGPANGASMTPSVNGDGSKVAFNSYATNLAPEPDQNHGKLDVYLWTAS